MIGQPRTPGRHRAGQPSASTPVHRRVWDGPARSEAERLDQAWQGWSVLYGPGSRLFYAIATWPVPEGLIVSARTPQELEARVYEAEMAMVARRQTPAPVVSVPPSRRGGDFRFPGARRRAVRPFRTLPYPPEGSAA